MDRKFIISQYRSPGHPLVWSSWKIFWLSSEAAEISWLPFRLLLPEARSLLLCCSPVPRLPARGLLLTSPSVLELCSAPQCSCTARFHYSFQQHGVFPDSLIDPSVIITNQLFPPAPCPLIECAMLSLYFCTFVLVMDMFMFVAVLLICFHISKPAPVCKPDSQSLSFCHSHHFHNSCHFTAPTYLFVTVWDHDSEAFTHT